MDQNDKEYSVIGNELKTAFNMFKERGYNALFVCANNWGALPFQYVAAPKGIWPWAAFDDDILVKEGLIGTPLIAFDLKGVFEAQMPVHLRKITEIDCFHVSPLIHIADRTGKIPAKEQEAFRKRALRQASPLKLVVDNTR